jgi:hypothetical protein
MSAAVPQAFDPVRNARKVQTALLGTYEDDEQVRAEPFDAVELDLASIWAR